MYFLRSLHMLRAFHCNVGNSASLATGAGRSRLRGYWSGKGKHSDAIRTNESEPDIAAQTGPADWRIYHEVNVNDVPDWVMSADGRDDEAIQQINYVLLNRRFPSEFCIPTVHHRIPVASYKHWLHSCSTCRRVYIVHRIAKIIAVLKMLQQLCEMSWKVNKTTVLVASSNDSISRY